MGKVPTLTNILNRIGVQNFNSLSPADQLFIKTNSGYRGPTVFGENTGGGNVDPFGMNVESLMGNYAEGVRDNFSQLQDTLTKDSRAKDGVTFNEITGEFESDTLTDKELAAYNKKTNMIRNKFVFRKKQKDQQDKDQRDIDKKAVVDANITKKSNNNTGGGGGYVQPKGSYDTDKSTGGSGDHRTMGSAPQRNYSQHTKSGAYGLREGGRAGYFYGGRVNFKNGGLASIL